MRTTLLFVLIAFYLSACDSKRLFEENRDIKSYWLADSTANFAFEITNPSIDYNLFFAVRNGVGFPHSNLYFKYFLKDSLGTTLETELINLQLFHPKSGYPLGDGIGDMFEHQYELLTKYRFANPGIYELSFQQYMRYDSLPEIYSVGYRIEKTINH
jgi:gliding motility-associated lipoprotein GldH